jgi:uncharacterized protein YgiM (DUF1202 family)
MKLDESIRHPIVVLALVVSLGGGFVAGGGPAVLARLLRAGPGTGAPTSLVAVASANSSETVQSTVAPEAPPTPAPRTTSTVVAESIMLLDAPRAVPPLAAALQVEGEQDAEGATEQVTGSSPPSELAEPPLASSGTSAPPAELLVMTVVSDGFLNLRTGPGFDTEIVGEVPRGTQGVAVARSADNQWVRVQFLNPPRQVWVSALPDLVSLEGDINLLPDVP